MRALLSRQQLADHLGVAEESVRRWERGGSQPSTQHEARLIAVLAIAEGYFGTTPSRREELPELSRRLVQERFQRGITQVEAAKIVGVAQATYAGWEIGRSVPGSASRGEIAEYLGLTLLELDTVVTSPFVVDTHHWPPLGRLMGARRASSRLTRDELARRVGVATSTVVAWELGHRAPRAHQLPILAAALGVSVSELVEAIPIGELSALGRLIRSRAAQLGLKLGDVASRARVDESTLSRWLHGHRTPALSSLSRLAVALELPFPEVRAAAGLAF